MNQSNKDNSESMVEVRFKRIELKDLQFDQGDTFYERGQFGDVKRAKWNGKVVAVKVFSAAERKNGFSQELVSLSLLQTHDKIVILHGACPTDHVTKRPFLVLEFAPLSLQKVLHECKKIYSYTADHVMSWSHQMALGLEYIHGKNMLHRDIKPSNILLFDDGRRLKYCDFGTAKKLENTLSNTNAVGTIRYMAPEVIKGKEYTYYCDIFSYGIVLWEMLTRRQPVLSTARGHHFAIMLAMAEGATPQKIPNIPKPLAQLIDKCFDITPSNRPKIIEIRKKLAYLLQFTKNPTPLIHRRQGKKDPCCPVSTQQGDQQHTPRVSADSAVKEETPAEVTGQPESAIPGTAGYRSQSQFTEARDRSQTVPERPKQIPTGTQTLERPTGVSSQISFPPMSSSSPSYQSPQEHFQQSPHASGYNTIAGRGRHGYGHQESEHGVVFVSEDLLSDKDNLQGQSERYQMIAEVMKRHTNFPLAGGMSRYGISGLEPELQPIIPNENNPQSMDLYHQYSAVAEEMVRARREYEELLEENKKLNREMENDRLKLAKQSEFYTEYEKQCKLKDQLMAEYDQLDKEHTNLMAKNLALPRT